MNAELDAQVRLVDEDRWLASRFASPAARARLTALYVVNHEVARAAFVVRDPTLGRIRLTWWREAIEEIHLGKPTREHPALTAYAAAHRETPFSMEVMIGLVEAHFADFEAAPFSTREDLDRYLDATAGALLGQAVIACGCERENDALIAAGGRAWGFLNLPAVKNAWNVRQRSFVPSDDDFDTLSMTAEFDYLTVRDQAPTLKVSSAAFPAVGYLALAKAKFLALRTGRELSLLARQLRLIGASALGGL